MSKVDIYNMAGEVTGSRELNAAIFGIEPNQTVMHQVVKGQLANRRQGTSSTKGRSEVRGGGRKPWRQKGTGRARQGSIRAAQWVGGGVIFGPTPRSYRQLLPKKIRRLALKSALSQKVLDQRLTLVDSLAMEETKTKRFVEVLKALKVEGSALVITEGGLVHLERSARNVPCVRTERVDTLNVYDVLKYDQLVLTTAALDQIEEVYA